MVTFHDSDGVMSFHRYRLDSDSKFAGVQFEFSTDKVRSGIRGQKVWWSKVGVDPACTKDIPCFPG